MEQAIKDTIKSYTDDCEGCGEAEGTNARHDCGCKMLCDECLPKHDVECEDFKTTEKGELSEYFCDEHPDYNLLHDGNGGHYCEECDMEDHFHILSKIAEENGIKHSEWAFDGYDDPVRDFSKPHGFTASMVDSGCGHGSHCYGVSLHGNKPTKPVQLIGDTWLDVWKSIDRHCRQKKCGHRYIELIEQQGDTLVVSCGS